MKLKTIFVAKNVFFDKKSMNKKQYSSLIFQYNAMGWD